MVSSCKFKCSMLLSESAFLQRRFFWLSYIPTIGWESLKGTKCKIIWVG
uniref:Uncharacterized protein n=1 Tax=Arundo donax TaxID=35708 RepID=A0A0A9HGW5_ARUDO